MNGRRSLYLWLRPRNNLLFLNRLRELSLFDNILSRLFLRYMLFFLNWFLFLFLHIFLFLFLFDLLFLFLLCNFITSFFLDFSKFISPIFNLTNHKPILLFYLDFSFNILIKYFHSICYFHFLFLYFILKSISFTCFGL